MLSCTPGNGGFSALFLFRCEMTTEKNKKLRFSLQNWDLYVILKKFYTGNYVKTYKFCWILAISLTPFRLSLFCRNCILSEAGATRSTDSCLSSIYGPHSGQQLTMMPTMMTGRSFMNFKNSPQKVGWTWLKALNVLQIYVKFDWTIASPITILVAFEVTIQGPG